MKEIASKVLSKKKLKKVLEKLKIKHDKLFEKKLKFQKKLDDVSLKEQLIFSELETAKTAIKSLESAKTDTKKKTIPRKSVSGTKRKSKTEK